MTNYWETDTTQPETVPELVGIDGFLPNVQMVSKNGCYRQVLHGHVPPLPFAEGSFDTVLLIEVVEHLPDEGALELIREAKRVALQRVILSTPNFPSLRSGHKTLTGFNEMEAHVSFLSRRTLRRMGFQLYGAGLRRGPKDLCRILYRLHLLKFYDNRFRIGLRNISYWFPCLSENVVGVWTRQNSSQGK